MYDVKYYYMLSMTISKERNKAIRSAFIAFLRSSEVKSLITWLNKKNLNESDNFFEQIRFLRNKYAFQKDWEGNLDVKHLPKNSAKIRV